MAYRYPNSPQLKKILRLSLNHLAVEGRLINNHHIRPDGDVSGLASE
jgi:hypothetical protein